MLQLIAWLLILISVTVFGLTCPIGHGVRMVFVPSLIPWFGLWFAVVYLGLQLALGFWFRNRRMLLTIGGVSLFGIVAATVGFTFDFVDPLERYEIGMARHLMVTGACFSGVVLGVGILKRWFP